VREIVENLQPFLRENTNALFHSTVFGFSGHKDIVSLDPASKENPFVKPKGTVVMGMLVSKGF